MASYSHKLEKGKVKRIQNQKGQPRPPAFDGIKRTINESSLKYLECKTLAGKNIGEITLHVYLDRKTLAD